MKNYTELICPICLNNHCMHCKCKLCEPNLKTNEKMNNNKNTKKVDIEDFKAQAIKEIKEKKVDVRPEIIVFYTHNNKQEAMAYNNGLDEAIQIIKDL